MKKKAIQELQEIRVMQCTGDVVRDDVRLARVSLVNHLEELGLF